MANLTDSSTWEPGIYQLETGDSVLGGAGGTSNQQAQLLANRTKWLYDQNATNVTDISNNTASISSQDTTISNILSYLPIHLRHAVLDGSVGTTGKPNALKILSGASRSIGLDDTSGDNLSGTGPLWIAFSDGYKTSARIKGAEDYFRKVGTSVASSGTFTLTLPSTDADYLVFAEYDSGASTTSLNYVNSFASGGYVASAYQPTVTVLRALWFNPYTQKHQITTDTGSSWTDVIAVVLGEGTISSATLTAVKNFPYQKPLYDTITPAGSFLQMATEETPLGGYLYCDGSAVSRAQYARLYELLGTAYGVGDGSTTFNLPDGRGYFMRGFDDGAGVDTSRVFGAVQTDELKSHAHDISGLGNSITAGTNTVYLVDNASGNAGTATTQVEGGTETRPKNITMKLFIKY